MTITLPPSVTPAAPGSTAAPAPHAIVCTTYDGPGVWTKWGTVQVEASIAPDGTICAVDAIQTPNDRRKSVAINDRAVPILDANTLAAQGRLGRHLRSAPRQLGVAPGAARRPGVRLDAGPPHRFTRRVMGTVTSIHVHDHVSPDVAESTVGATSAELRAPANVSTFRPTSEIVGINRTLLDCSAEVIEVLDACTWLARERRARSPSGLMARTGGSTRPGS